MFAGLQKLGSHPCQDVPVAVFSATSAMLILQRERKGARSGNRDDTRFGGDGQALSRSAVIKSAKMIQIIKKDPAQRKDRAGRWWEGAEPSIGVPSNMAR